MNSDSSPKSKIFRVLILFLMNYLRFLYCFILTLDNLGVSNCSIFDCMTVSGDTIIWGAPEIKFGAETINCGEVLINWGTELINWETELTNCGAELIDWGATLMNWAALSSWGLALMICGVAMISWGVELMIWGVAPSREGLDLMVWISTGLMSISCPSVGLSSSSSSSWSKKRAGFFLALPDLEILEPVQK